MIAVTIVLSVICELFGVLGFIFGQDKNYWLFIMGVIPGIWAIFFIAIIIDWMKWNWYKRFHK